MFIGREKELADLDRSYNSGKFEFFVIYGRRRVGKTTLIRRFIQNKKTIYFTGMESNEKQNLESLSEDIMEYSTGIRAGSSFISFRAALEYVFNLAKDERLIFVIDEYPYIARSSESFASTLQLLIDRYKDTSRLMLILCGSSMSYMEDNVLAYKSPLYGRRTAQIKLLPFDFADTCKYLKGYPAEDKALIYGIAGGTPQYLLQIDTSLSVEDNIKNTFLNPSSFLFEEPENTLKQELREPANYSAIITAIAGGASHMSEISTGSGVPTSACAMYLKHLIELDLIQKESPYGQNASKKTIYNIADNMFRFWYRFVPENRSLITMGAADMVYERIKPELSDYMGRIFEEICTQYLWKELLQRNLPICFKDLGRWWGTDPATRSQAEIDIMGEQDKSTALFAECKWTNEEVDAGILESLRSKSSIFHYSDTYLYLFSKSGFTKGCMEEAEKMRNVCLIKFTDMFSEIDQAIYESEQ